MCSLRRISFVVATLCFTSTAQPTSPAIFYAPHPDDDAIAMAGAIREHKDAGRQVYMVLLTNGFNSGLRDILNGNTLCTWHNTYHDCNLTQDQVNWARKVEFIQSAKALGADSIFILNDGSGINEDPNIYDTIDAVNKIVQTVLQFEGRFPGASHKLVSGYYDVDPWGGRNPTHKACWDAGFILRDNYGIWDLKFYRVYVYYFPANQRTSQYQLYLNSSQKTKKQAAILEYKKFYTYYGRYGLGYHSVSGLLDEAANSDYEYYDCLP